MKAFVVYPSYQVEDGKAYVYLFGRQEDGKSFITRNLYRPFFYIREADAKKAEVATETCGMKNFKGEPVVKVVLDIPGMVPKVRDSLHAAGILTYEADIRFPYRFMMDKGIRGSMEIIGNGIPEGRHVFYNEPEFALSEHTPKLKILSIDIETAMDAKSLYCVSLAGEDFTKIYLVGKKSKGISCFDTASDLLNELREDILAYDPDIITGWNLIDFDLKVLMEQYLDYGLDFRIGRVPWAVKLKLSDNFMKESKADIPGRVVLDGIQLLKMNFISLPDYKLQTAAIEILGDRKLDVFDELDKGAEIERLYETDPRKLALYNLKDAELVLRILEKKDVVATILQRSLLTGMQPDRVNAAVASLDNLYIREAHKRGYVSPTSMFHDTEERIRGGYVMESKPGIYDFINVYDFKSLYPSIIRTFNIDPLTHSEDGEIETANGEHFRKEPGVLPSIIAELGTQRELAKKQKKDVVSYAIKITMNSFFGVLANPSCRYYSLAIANAITHTGQSIVKESASIVEGLGYKVIYGDTDSIFVQTEAHDIDGAKAVGEKIHHLVNLHWARKMQDRFRVPSYLELQYEKTFIRFLMPMMRGVERGAKKRYAGLRMRDGKESIEFTGMEFVRRDWTMLSKEFQMGLMDRIFHKLDVQGFITEFVRELEKGKLDHLLVYRKAIRKDLGKYTKTTPPHVKAARQLPRITSNVISYVITTAGPEPVQIIKHPLDYKHYIDKQLKPIADSILVFYRLKFDELLQGQKSLSGF